MFQTPRSMSFLIHLQNYLDNNLTNNHDSHIIHKLDLVIFVGDGRYNLMFDKIVLHTDHLHNLLNQ